MTFWRHPPNSSRFIHTILSTINKISIISNSTTGFKTVHLTTQELNEGCMLKIDSWADTCCLVKHAYIREFIEG